MKRKPENISLLGVPIMAVVDIAVRIASKILKINLSGIDAVFHWLFKSEGSKVYFNYRYI